MRNSEQAAVPGGVARESQKWGVMRKVRVLPYGFFLRESPVISFGLRWRKLEMPLVSHPQEKQGPRHLPQVSGQRLSPDA